MLGASCSRMTKILCLGLLCGVLPGGGGLALHLLTVPDLDGTVVGGGGEDGVLIGDADPVDGGPVLVEVGHEETLRVPPCTRTHTKRVLVIFLCLVH